MGTKNMKMRKRQHILKSINKIELETELKNKNIIKMKEKRKIIFRVLI